MHDTVIKMKDGRKFCGPIWEFNPEQGYLTLAGEDAEAGRLYFRDMESAVTKNERVSIDMIGVDHDVLEFARKEGWNGE